MRVSLQRLFLGLALLSAPGFRLPVPGSETLITYQGLVQSGGTNFAGAGQFKFALVSGGPDIKTLWSNDGTSVSGSEPKTGVSVVVNDGLFKIIFGDANMHDMLPIKSEVFGQSGLHLRIWFNDGANGFSQLIPDQPVTSVPKAATADVLTGTVAAQQLTGMIAASSIGPLNASNVASGILGQDRIPPLDASKVTTGTLSDALLSPRVVRKEERVIVMDGDSISDKARWLRYFTNLSWFASGNTVLLTNFATGSDGVGFGHPDAIDSMGGREINSIVIDSNGLATATISNVDLTTGASRLYQKRLVIRSASTPSLLGFYDISAPVYAATDSTFTFQTKLKERTILDARLDCGVMGRYADFIRPLRPKAGQVGYFICYIGLNDCGRVYQNGNLSGLWGVNGGWANAYSNLMTCARADGFKVVAFTMHVQRAVWTGSGRNALIAMNNYIRTCTVSGTGIALWDYLVDLEQSFPNPYDTRLNDDGLHLTGAGYEVLAAEADRVLRGAAHYTAPNTPFSPEIGTTPVYWGTTNPSAYFAAPPGTMYIWRGGPPGQVLWIKENGTNADGWVAK